MPGNGFIVVVKNILVIKRFFLQTLMPQFRHWVFLNRVR